jgi:predicted outer membrane repeat protein
VITGAGLAAGAALGMASGAQAAATNYYVGSAADTALGGDCANPANSDCTLRDAINDANTNVGADTIYFNSTISGTPIVLGSDLPVIDDPVYIVGNGPSDTVVSGDDSHQIFHLDMANDGDDVGLYALTLTHGHADDGGAVYNTNATLQIGGALLTGNTASENGGAIYDKNNEDATGHGQANTISYSTISNNFAVGDGGGVYGFYSVGTIGTSTINGNRAGSSNVGGGVSSWSPSFTYSSTVSGNTAGAGGGFANRHGYGALYNSIVGPNTATIAPDAVGTFYSGFNLVKNPAGAHLDPASSAGNSGANLTGVDPQLGPLADNGGDLPTRRPAASSPVVDQGLSEGIDDERGFPRPVDNPNVANAVGGDGGDIGAVELTLGEGPQAPPGPTPGPGPTPTTFNVKKAIKHCKKKFHGKAKAKPRKKCIKKAKRRARASAASSSNPWRADARRWAKSASTRASVAHHGHHAFGNYRP